MARQLLSKLRDGRESCLDDAALKLNRLVGVCHVDKQVKCLMQGKDQMISVWIPVILIRRHVGVGFNEEVAINLLPGEIALLRTCYFFQNTQLEK